MPLDIECMVKLSCVLTYHQAFSHVFDTFIAWPKFICPATKRACASRSSGSSRSFGSRRSSECRWSIHFVTRPCQTFFLTPSFVSVAKTGFQNGQMLQYFYISICLSWSLWTSLLLYWALLYISLTREKQQTESNLQTCSHIMAKSLDCGQKKKQQSHHFAECCHMQCLAPLLRSVNLRCSHGLAQQNATQSTNLLTN